MHSKDHCEIHWSLRLPYIVDRGKPIEVSEVIKEVKRQFRLYKRRVKLYRLRKKLRVP